MWFFPPTFFSRWLQQPAPSSWCCVWEELPWREVGERKMRRGLFCFTRAVTAYVLRTWVSPFRRRTLKAGRSNWALLACNQGRNRLQRWTTSSPNHPKLDGAEGEGFACTRHRLVPNVGHIDSRRRRWLTGWIDGRRGVWPHRRFMSCIAITTTRLRTLPRNKSVVWKWLVFLGIRKRRRWRF